jgi:hypothetical protein
MATLCTCVDSRETQQASRYHQDIYLYSRVNPNLLHIREGLVMVTEGLSGGLRRLSIGLPPNPLGSEECLSVVESCCVFAESRVCSWSRKTDVLNLT